MKDTGSKFSAVGQERVHVKYNDQYGEKPLPHGNRFGIVIGSKGKRIIKGTSLPTYLRYDNFDPFSDDSYDVYNKYNHFRVAGLIRVTVY